MSIFCDNVNPAITLSFQSSIAWYHARATSRAFAVFTKSFVLSIPDTFQKSVSVAHGSNAVTVTFVSYNSSAKAFEKEVTYAFVA